MGNESKYGTNSCESDDWCKCMIVINILHVTTMERDDANVSFPYFILKTYLDETTGMKGSRFNKLFSWSIPVFQMSKFSGDVAALYNLRTPCNFGALRSALILFSFNFVQIVEQ